MVARQVTATGLDADQAQELQRALGRIARRVRSRTSEGLTPSQLTCLGAIVRDGPIRVSEVATREGINPTALSRILGRLDEAGLVVRTADPTDRRAAVLAVTRKGRRVLEHVRAERTTLILERVSHLDDADAEAIAAALPALTALAAALEPRVAGEHA